MYDLGVARMSDQQSILNKTQQQVATGRRIQTPADDPAGAASVVDLTQLDGMNTQYQKNRDNAKNSLNVEQGVFQQLSDLLQSAKSLALSAGNATLNNADRASLATELQGQLQQLIGLANSRDGAGNYLFAGQQSTTQPFSQGGTPVQYAGDSGSRALQVSDTRQLPITDSGQQVFMNVPAGNGKFATAGASANTGTGVIGAGTVVNVSQLTGHDYRLDFAVAGGVTTYSVVDVSAGTTLSSGNPYTSGSPITVAGMQVDVQGSPAAGDQFNVVSGAKQSLFQTLQNLVNVLSTPVNTQTDQAALSNGLNAALSGLDTGLNHILETQSAVGSRLKELDNLDSSGQDLHLQYQQALSKLQDLDYNKALSDLAMQQNVLEAAQKSFAKVTGLSLFNYL
jgi:flagellar hook-associated protein 3 FlgL